MTRIIIDDLLDDQRDNDKERKKALGVLDDRNEYTEDLNQPRGGYSSGCGCGCS